MDAKTREALEGSIEKWRKIIEEGGFDDGPVNCPLCKLFYNDDCRGCPVVDAAGVTHCMDTPYVAWENYQNMGGGNQSYRAVTEQAKSLARAEYDFLRGLLPADQSEAKP